MMFNPNDAGTFRWESPTGGTSPDGSSAAILPDGTWWYYHKGSDKPVARGTAGGQEAVMRVRAARLRDEEAKARKGGEGA
jgi:hypothetical protein